MSLPRSRRKDETTKTVCIDINLGFFEYKQDIVRSLGIGRELLACPYCYAMDTADT